MAEAGTRTPDGGAAALKSSAKESSLERTRFSAPAKDKSTAAPVRPAVKKTEPVPPAVKAPAPSKDAKSSEQTVEGVGRRTGSLTGNVGKVGKTIRPTRKARLRLARLDPWSVMKTAFMFSIASAIIGLVAVAILWSVVEASGAIDKLQEAMNAVLGNADGAGQIQIRKYIDLWRVLGLTTLISAINVVLITAIATLGAFLYNLTANLLGGLEVTLSEDLNS